jgi:4'-phosphopantetheinyl transferase
VIARAALRHLLGGYLDLEPARIEFALGANQKPVLSGPHAASGLQFNVSHSGEMALIAIAKNCDVGVDIEQVRAVGHLEDIAKKFFHPTETEAIFAMPAQTRHPAFLRCWTAKEAVLKALGKGITGSLSDFEISIDRHWQGWIECGGSRWWVQRLTFGEDYVGAVACVESKRSVRCWTFTI